MQTKEEMEPVKKELPLWKEFVILTKPRILMSNSITAFGGFWLASRWSIDWFWLVVTLAGTLFVMASGCVLNNYLDREHDARMERTRGRALPEGRLSPDHVFWFGIALGLIGLIILGNISLLCACLGFIGHFVYVVIYTAWLKPTSTLSTAVGGISGAMPPVIGYCAVSGYVNYAALILFAILFLWQPPHFWALGINRLEEYRAADYPLLPVVKGIKRTKIQMIPYVVLIIPVSALLYFYDYAGIFYLIASVLLGAFWLYKCLQGFKTEDDTRWSKSTFMYSVNYLTLVFLVMILDTVHK